MRRFIPVFVTTTIALVFVTFGSIMLFDASDRWAAQALTADIAFMRRMIVQSAGWLAMSAFILALCRVLKVRFPMYMFVLHAAVVIAISGYAAAALLFSNLFSWLLIANVSLAILLLMIMNRFAHRTKPAVA